MRASNTMCVIVGGASIARMALAEAMCMYPDAELVIVNPAEQEAERKRVHDSLVLSASNFEALVYVPELRKSARERSHPNEPFYRNLSRRRSRW